MLKNLANWLDSRTGYKALVHEALDEPIPGGARWRYVWGSALTSTFMIQLVTGLLLMTSYSPSSTTAWGSVFYISHRMAFGWFIRGLHHFGSQAMVVLLALHLVQVLWAGAYRAPREVNWWFGMALLFLTLGFSLTGYLLPWDQKGYWATKVATNIAGGAPGLGPYIQAVVVGGDEYGNQTLTRFYGLHVGVLPTLLVLCLAAHVALFRKHGVTAPRHAKGEVGRFWPEQIFMDTVASLAVFGVLAFLVVSQEGADLDAPADPARTSGRDYPARPEWYFLSLFQMLKLFPGNLEVVGTIIVPTAILVVLLAFPLLDKVLPGKVAHFLACMVVFALIGGVGYLTVAAIREDRNNAEFRADRELADESARRALQLARLGIPPEGAGYLLSRDPLFHGRQVVLETKCLSCHYYDGHGMVTRTVVVGAEGKSVETRTESPQTAADLKDYPTRSWVLGLLRDPDAAEYFGKVPQCKGMKTWKKSSKLGADDLSRIADFVATFADIPADMAPEEWVGDPKLKVDKHPGFEPFRRECLGCHIVGTPGLLTGEETQDVLMDAPNLYGWGSSRWLEQMIRRPSTPGFYGYLSEEEQMPGFGGRLTDDDLASVIRYLKGDFVPPLPRTEARPAAPR